MPPDRLCRPNGSGKSSFVARFHFKGKEKLAKVAEFRVRLVFICLDNPGLNIDRVGERVSRGGHHVPDPDVVRRYERSLENRPAALRIADEAVACDNSGPAPPKVFEARNGAITWRSPDLPTWANSLTAL